MHLDLDVLDEKEFPATDYLMPGGLEMTHLADLLRPLGQDASLIGVSIGCYNPQKDPGGAVRRGSYRPARGRPRDALTATAKRRTKIK